MSKCFLVNILLNREQTSSNIYKIILTYFDPLALSGYNLKFYLLGPAYIDENVSPKASPIYLGVWFTTTMLGIGIGAIVGGSFLKYFTNIDMVSVYNIMCVGSITYASSKLCAANIFWHVKH